MDNNISVKPQVGHYVVSVANRFGVQIHHVTKGKRCTCGGSSERRCAHIRAVVTYLKKGGCRAQEPLSLALRDRGGPLPGSPAQLCPICGATVRMLDRDMWRCPRDASHFWQWRGERNGGAVRRFFTEPHLAKQGAFYEQSIEDREAFLHRVAHHTHSGGYTPHD